MTENKNRLDNVKETVSEHQYHQVILKNIKHDLINPINAMIGYSELILDTLDEAGDRALKRDMQSIYHSSTAIFAIIQELFSDKTKAGDDIGSVILNEDLHYSIRTPLSNIVGLSELILEDTATVTDLDLQDIQDSVSKINQAGKRLLKLINDLSKYSDLSDSDLMENYYTDLYLKESSIRNFQFNTEAKIPDKIGTILIVDDESANLDIIDKILQQSNHKTFTAESGEEALKILKKESAKIDLILLDLIMPEVNGMDLLKTLKDDNNTYHIPVIMLSALDEIDTIVECISMGADDFLIKPVNRILLHARLNNALEKKYFHDKEIKYQKQIKIEQEKSDKLLLNILPESIAERLKNGESLIADDFEDSTVLFADLAGFTKLSSTISATDVVMQLNSIFSLFDGMLIKYSLEKIKTIGDCYMLAGGLPKPDKNHADSVARMALEMLDIIKEINTKTNQSLKVRIGINSGPVAAGVIGKEKFIYDLWGDTVNVASRMETFGSNSKIHVSSSTYLQLKDYYNFTKRDKINIPGKGAMQTYFLNSLK
ncbi:MAG TPA: adenylate/guanylate cyclase domain-containing protein [Candidatus Marinimicrobia bacterium]|jgi:class 3 adenylate cyclase/CheY-like chemotaxis protein|nr:adenylate/guanylate cyclase domain-containing protein [Candidatus Neomarinimicrobiota bacterium]